MEALVRFLMQMVGEIILATGFWGFLAGLGALIVIWIYERRVLRGRD